MISRDELRRHKKYFDENVVVRLEEIKKEMEQERKAGKFCSRKRWKFIKFCLYYKKCLAIGKPKKLQQIEDIIAEKYAEFLENDMEFKKQIEDAFGYDKFSCLNVGVETVERAKQKAGLPKSANYDDKNVLKELLKELDNCSKSLKEAFQERLKQYKHKTLKKEDLVSILSEVLITYMMENDVSVNLLPEWNPYLLQYSRKVRTCPYCNRQYITPFYSENGKIRADLDHFLPKSKYPYFSMSIYNLIPCCKFCNSSLKGTREFSSVIEKTFDISVYEISIDDIAEFWYWPGSEKKVRFYDRKAGFGAEAPAVEIYKDMFKIEELYSYHQNKAEDILEKRIKYSSQRINDLVSTGLVSEKELYQLIWGKVCKKEEILEEPLNKFKRDIMKEFLGEKGLYMLEE